MKKIFTLIAVLTAALSSLAADYQGLMKISLNGGEPTEQDATVSAVRSESGDNIYYEITLKQFSFNGMLIGDVTISGVGADDTVGMGGYSFFHETTKEAPITNGGEIAAMLGGTVTATIKEGSCVNDDNLYLKINLPVTIFGSTINVDATFGNEPNFPKYYNDKLTVTIEGSEDPIPAQDATIIVTKQDDGKYKLELRNFEIKDEMTVGTIEVTDIDAVEENGVIKLTAKQTVTIKDGEYERPDGWAMSGIPVDIDLKADMTDDKLYAEIGIIYTIMPGYGMNINVVFGDDGTSGIVKTTAGNGVETVYDINGNRIDGMKKGINIIRKADGTTVKVIKR